MKLQFDPHQTFQLDAVSAMTDIFDSQPQGIPEYAVIRMGAWGSLFAGQERTELGVGNRLLLDADKLLANTRTIQSRNGIEVENLAALLEAWKLFDGPANQVRLCPHFSVEMETGTGKTYVYLRTIFALSQCYGFQKFIIVVPSVAIRIDRVANYRDYDGAGQMVQGKFAAAFEAEFTALARDERYRALAWLQEPIAKLHNGYFAQDKKGVLKDTRGDTQADDDVYTLIMKDKERLLSLHEPLRFIFSHSALREGWDNPNVFQICTLNETRSVMKKRQEIGRGLRLPVDQNGLRVFDDSVNKLYVMANESYEDFARSLQTEYEEECGVTFGKVPLTALARISRVLDGREQPIGRDAAAVIYTALVEQKMLDADGRIQPTFDPKRKNFKLALPETQRDLTPAVVDLLSSYQIERHIRKERDEGVNRLKKGVTLSPEFQALWERIKPKTTYRVEFETEVLVRHAVAAMKRMERIETPRVRVVAGQLRNWSKISSRCHVHSGTAR